MSVFGIGKKSLVEIFPAFFLSDRDRLMRAMSLKRKH